MSCMMKIDYEHIAIECRSICEVAENQLCELDKMLSTLIRTSSNLINEDTSRLEAEIRQERSALLSEIERARLKADSGAKRGEAMVDSDSEEYKNANNVTRIAKKIRERVNSLAAGRLVEMRALLDTLLFESIASHENRLKQKARGDAIIDKSIRDLLDSISDSVLRQFTYIVFAKDPTLSNDELLACGRELMDEAINGRKSKEREMIREELAAARITKEAADKIVDSGKPIGEIRAEATEQIVSEKIRRESMKIIMNAIRERGFIVDKKNIKIDRKENKVTMVAMKASGERATFHVFLDGRFIYDFRGYEGQACQKDIEPFMSALEEVYGMHVSEAEEMWSNPDKISSMKYMEMNTNKAKR